MGEQSAIVRQNRIQGLDALRGVAIALVMVRHAWPDVVGSAGAVGVAIFFALSGYLITGILLRDVRSRGAVRYGRFYRNRVLRLYPPLLFLLFGICVVTFTIDPLRDRGTMLRSLIIALTYTGDLPIPGRSPTIGHLWTLATEEQFYIVWPVIIALGVIWRRLGLFVIAAGAVIMLGFAATVVVSQPDMARIYTLPSSWALTMVMGAAAAIWRERVEHWMPRTGSGRTSVAVACTVGLLALAALPEDKSSAALYVILGPVTAALTIVLIAQVRHWDLLPSRWLVPLLWLGTISYAVYLWNYPVALWTSELPLGGPLSIGLSILMGTVSWWILERPVQAWKARLDRPGRISSGSTGEVEGSSL